MHKLSSSPFKTLILSIVAILLIGLYLLPNSALNQAKAATPLKNPHLSTAQAADLYHHLPLSFEHNQGQVDYDIDFIARGAGYNLLLKPTQATLYLHHNQGDAKDIAIQMQLVGANTHAQLQGEMETNYKSNYLIGRNSQDWHTDIANYAKVRSNNVYPGIDIIYYGQQHQLEYDFVVAPQADPHQIRLDFSSNNRPVDSIKIDREGNLVVTMAGQQVVQHKPVIYQLVEGSRREITGGYQCLNAHQVGFSLGNYDHNYPLIIDPVLSYSSFFGGTNHDEGLAIAVDSSGQAYVTGCTNSINLPTQGALQTANKGMDAFILKLNTQGNGLIYATYFGGTSQEAGQGIAVDTGGNAYVTGFTTSTDFPVSNPLQSTYGGGVSDGFLVKLNPGGNALVYSTYFGGSGFDQGIAVVVDNLNNVYLTGQTDSIDLPRVRAAQTDLGGGTDGFLIKLGSNGTSIVYSTYIGGNDDESSNAVAVDKTGNAYLVGDTASVDFPVTSGVVQPRLNNSDDAFAVKYDPNGKVIYATYLGGTDDELGLAVVADDAGNAYVVGDTLSTDFPIKNAFQAMLAGDQDIFITKLNLTGNSLVFSTYLGGSDTDIVFAVALDISNNPYVVGGTASVDFPMKDPAQANNAGMFDAFATQLDNSGKFLIASTYLGGRNSDFGFGIGLDAVGNAYVSGTTFSTDFPTLNGVRPGFNGGDSDAFIAKLGGQAAPDFVLQVTPMVQNVITGNSANYTINVVPSNGFNQTANLSAVLIQLDNKVTPSLSTTAIKPGTPATLTVNTGTDAMSGPRQVVITAVSGQIARSVTVTLNITTGFTLSVNPTQLSVTRGQQSNITVSINRDSGFNNSITINSPDAKNIGVKLSPGSANSAGNSVSFTLKIKKKASFGNQQLTLVGQDSAGRIARTTLNLMIK